MLIVARRAAVRPRVVSPVTGEAAVLEDEIRDLLERGTWGVAAVAGGSGAGKTTALRHLAAVLDPGSGVEFLDEAAAAEVRVSAVNRLIVSTVPVSDREIVANFLLAPWDDDDLLEYLLNVHRDRCGSVMDRLRADPARGFLEGVPALWAPVLDLLAAERGIVSVKAALREVIHAAFSDPKERKAAGDFSLGSLSTPAVAGGREFLDAHDLFQRFARPKRPPLRPDLLIHPAVTVLMAAEGLIESLKSENRPKCLMRRFSRELVLETASQASGDPAAVDRLRYAVREFPEARPMGGSVLHHAGAEWRLPAEEALDLSGAYLEGAAWPGANLKKAVLLRTDLARANLEGADLSGADAMRARFGGANLRGTMLQASRGEEGDFSGADLSEARAANGDFPGANFRGANLREAALAGVGFWGADLTEADFRGADLTGAGLAHARIGGAVFDLALLRSARLSRLKLTEASWAGARFPGADLTGCDLQGMKLPSGDFEGATLVNALLTGSVIPEARFARAVLRGAGLAGIEWEGADLRDADLRGAQFHMGSSRSGMIFTPIASEGSRTGFYTDDSGEQYFKAPEEIRKANLRGADLRGANIFGVDFYLVDLRGAIYTEEQADWFRRCRAIV